MDNEILVVLMRVIGKNEVDLLTLLYVLWGKRKSFGATVLNQLKTTEGDC